MPQPRAVFYDIEELTLSNCTVIGVRGGVEAIVSDVSPTSFESVRILRFEHCVVHGQVLAPERFAGLQVLVIRYATAIRNEFFASIRTEATGLYDMLEFLELDGVGDGLSQLSAALPRLRGLDGSPAPNVSISRRGEWVEVSAEGSPVDGVEVIASMADLPTKLAFERCVVDLDNLAQGRFLPR